MQGFGSAAGRRRRWNVRRGTPSPETTVATVAGMKDFGQQLFPEDPEDEESAVAVECSTRGRLCCPDRLGFSPFPSRLRPRRRLSLVLGDGFVGYPFFKRLWKG